MKILLSYAEHLIPYPITVQAYTCTKLVQQVVCTARITNMIYIIFKSYISAPTCVTKLTAEDFDKLLEQALLSIHHRGTRSWSSTRTSTPHEDLEDSMAQT